MESHPHSRILCTPFIADRTVELPRSQCAIPSRTFLEQYNRRQPLKLSSSTRTSSRPSPSNCSKWRARVLLLLLLLHLQFVAASCWLWMRQLLLD